MLTLSLCATLDNRSVHRFLTLQLPKDKVSRELFCHLHRINQSSRQHQKGTNSKKKNPSIYSEILYSTESKNYCTTYSSYCQMCLRGLRIFKWTKRHVFRWTKRRKCLASQTHLTVLRNSFSKTRLKHCIFDVIKPTQKIKKI